MAPKDQSSLIRDIIAFWFGAPAGPEFGQFRDVWFKQDDAFDASIKARFASHVTAARAGQLDSMAESAEGTVALLILLDQFPRNLFRGTAEAFSHDAKARDIARKALDRGFDQALPPFMRTFVYLPFEHSEDLPDQELSVRLFEAVGNPHTLDYAQRHFDIIQRFGRFPHRNSALGRASSAAEVAFFKEPGSGF